MPAGLYHRIESPSQLPADAAAQERSGELWGAAARFSDIPEVKAYLGPLPEGRRGVECTTTVAPDADCPPGKAYWSGPRKGVVIEEGRAMIAITVTRNSQTP